MSSVEQDIRDFLGWLRAHSAFILLMQKHERNPPRLRHWAEATDEDIEFLVESYLRQYGAVGDGEEA